MGVGLVNAQPGSMQLVSTKAFAANAVDFAGLTGDYEYRLVLRVASDGVSSSALELNADTTANHYWTQRTLGIAGVVSTGANNLNLLFQTSASSGYFIVDIGIDGSSYAFYSLCGMMKRAVPEQQLLQGQKTDATVTSITEIKVVSGGASITGTASLYRIAKV